MSTSPTPLSILIVVTHLLGVGHLSRMAALGRALAASGHRVVLASGGRPVPTLRTDGVELAQLPPVHCIGTDFATLLGPDSRPIDEEYRRQRVAALLDTLDRTDPDVLVTELFPFGRRALAEEFEAVLRAARARTRPPAVLASVRDILNPPSKPSRADEALARLGEHYDRVLVHGDSGLVPLAASWPVAPELARRLAYTGYVAEAAMPPPGPGPGAGEIVVSGGGSAASLPLYRATLGAASLLDAALRWRILVGHGVSQPEFESLKAAAPDNVTVERARPDFRELLARCALSVSQAGYNTVVELAQAGVRAVVVPFEAGKELEQALRAECFAKAGLFRVVREHELSPRGLADAVAKRLADPPAPPAAIDTDGLARSVALIEDAAETRQDAHAARQRLAVALDGLGAAGRRWRVWWRDDDAVSPCPALDRLLALAAAYGAPLSLAVIPALATPELADRLAGEEHVTALQHGWRHRNNAAPGEKKCELTGPACVDDLAQGRARLDELFARRFLAVLVPPWNRISPTLIPLLPQCGFAGLSTYKARPASEAAPGLAQVNTHWDPVAWKAGGGALDTVELLGALARHAEELCAGEADADEPFGLLTHHLVHDAWTWRIVEEAVAMLASHPAVTFIDARAAFRFSPPRHADLSA